MKLISRVRVIRATFVFPLLRNPEEEKPVNRWKLMDEMVRPLRIPAETSLYADKHHISHLVQSLVSSLVIDRPDDPISYLIDLLQRSTMDVPRVMILGPPAVGKHTLAKRLSTELRTVHVTMENLLLDQSELSVLTEQDLPAELLVPLVKQRLEKIDCVNRGWVLVGIPQTHWQTERLQQVGVLPEHVVLLEASDDVLLERGRGRMVDPLTGDVYHETFIWPTDNLIAERLERRRGLSEMQLLTELHRYRCEVTGVREAYQHVLKIISGDQPHTDVYQQVLSFVRTRRRTRTPRILLMGPPGSGKSHQAQLLSEKYKMVDVCCGYLLRSVAADGSCLGVKIQPYLDDGRPVPDSLVVQVLEERLSCLDCSCRGWILHGFPCDLQQAKSLQDTQHQPNRVYFLEGTDEVCLERTSLRGTDPVTGQRFHTVTRPAPSSEVQNRLQTRPEDRTKTVMQRLKQYRIQSAALQSMYPDAIHVDADQDPHSVFEALESRLTSE